jgi:hypothetical protein
MTHQEPNPASAKEQAEGSRDHVAPDAKKKADKAVDGAWPDDRMERDGKNDSGVDPEIHDRQLPGD